MHFLDPFVCPITCALPLDPVLAEDAQVYDRFAILMHLSKYPDGKCPSPMTNLPMGRTLTPARHVFQMLQSLVDQGGMDDERLREWERAANSTTEDGPLGAKKRIVDGKHVATVYADGVVEFYKDELLTRIEFPHGCTDMEKDDIGGEIWFFELPETDDVWCYMCERKGCTCDGDRLEGFPWCHLLSHVRIEFAPSHPKHGEILFMSSKSLEGEDEDDDDELPWPSVAHLQPSDLSHIRWRLYRGERVIARREFAQEHPKYGEVHLYEEDRDDDDFNRHWQTEFAAWHPRHGEKIRLLEDDSTGTFTTFARGHPRHGELIVDFDKNTYTSTRYDESHPRHGENILTFKDNGRTATYYDKRHPRHGEIIYASNERTQKILDENHPKNKTGESLIVAYHDLKTDTENHYRGDGTLKKKRCGDEETHFRRDGSVKKRLKRDS